MAPRGLWCVLLVLFNEFSPCLADSADPSVWDTKDNVKFGVAEPNVEVCVLCWCVWFAVLAGDHKQQQTGQIFKEIHKLDRRRLE